MRPCSRPGSAGTGSEVHAARTDALPVVAQVGGAAGAGGPPAGPPLAAQLGGHPRRPPPDCAGCAPLSYPVGRAALGAPYEVRNMP